MKTKQTKILSFIGGLLFAATVVGILLVRSENIREEVEDQARGFLDLSRNVLKQLQSVLGVTSTMLGTAKIANKTSKLDLYTSPPASKDYEDLWQAVETQSKAYVKNRLSR
jgi:uncharacterized protein (DUF3084 family)